MTSADRTDHLSLRRLRLPRFGLSRRVRFTNRFTEQAIDLQFPAPSAPFYGCRPWARHRVGTRQATAKRHGLDTRRVAPSRARRQAAPRPCHHRCRVCTWAPPAAVLSRPLPRTRLLPDRTADGFCPGSAQPITQLRRRRPGQVPAGVNTPPAGSGGGHRIPTRMPSGASPIFTSCTISLGICTVCACHAA